MNEITVHEYDIIKIYKDKMSVNTMDNENTEEDNNSYMNFAQI